MIKVFSLVVVLLAVGQLLVTNELASLGQSVGELDDRIEAAREVHELLGQEVASASSLLAIEEKAKELGFVEPTKTSYVTLSDLPLALGRQ